MGEFARSAAIARAALERWPRAAVHFMVSRHASYAAQVPFPVTLLPSSPTFHTRPVVEHMQAWRPDVVIFDNAGRSAQIRAAGKLARVVYISSRPRQRHKAFRLSWMRVLDEHWIAYPRFIAGELGAFERLKLKILHRPAVRYLDVVMARGERGAEGGSASGAADDALVIPGGGTGHPGAGNVTAEFLGAARALASRGFSTTFVGPAGAAAESPPLRAVGSLAQPELAARMRRARLVVVNGGSTLLQAIACGAACVAAPIAGDQLERIRRCVQAGAAVQAAPTCADIERKALSLLEDEDSRAALARRAAGLGLTDGIEVALAALGRLIEPA
jgi:hypothetical protein